MLNLKSIVCQILEQRQKLYGSFRRNAETTQLLKRISRVAPGWKRMSMEQREALDMINHKISRLLNGDPNTTDTWDGIAGYASLVSRSLRRDASSRSKS